MLFRSSAAGRLAQLGNSQDKHRPGRMRYAGSSFRSAALKVHDELKRLLESRCGSKRRRMGRISSAASEEQNVIYVHGDELVKWLDQLPARLNGPARAAVRQALRESRTALMNRAPRASDY